MCTIPNIQDFLQPLEDVIHQLFIPALFGRPTCSAMERNLYALPVCLGGLGLVNCHAAVGPPGLSTVNFVAIDGPPGPSMAAIDGPLCRKWSPRFF